MFPRSTLITLASCLFLPLVSYPHGDHETAPHFQWEKASADPDRIFLSPTKHPETSMSVTWRTDTTVETGFAQLTLADPSARFDLTAETMEANTSTLDPTISSLNPLYPSTNFHSIYFRNLKPNTLYAYRVGGGEEHWSEWFQFRTAKADKQPFRFLYFGDAQNGVYSHWSRAIRAAYAMAPDAAFTIHAGDLINRAHRDREWGGWFKAGGWIHATIPGLPVVGNHEMGKLIDDDTSQERTLSIQWPHQFTLPKESNLPSIPAETVYTLVYQGVRLVVLNSSEDYQIQAAWLDRVLTQNQEPWTVVTFHHPVFSSGSDRNNPEQRAAWKPILDKHKVDLVLQGHDHTYARGQTPLTLAVGGGGPQSPVTSVYVNSVSGAKMYKTNENRWDDYRDDGVELARMGENTQFFQVISIDNRRLEYQCYMTNGELYDRFVLLKNADGSKQLVNDSVAEQEERSFENSLPYAGGIGGI